MAKALNVLLLATAGDYLHKGQQTESRENTFSMLRCDGRRAKLKGVQTCLLSLSANPSVEVTADKVSDDDADVEDDDVSKMLCPEVEWYAEIVERVCYAVGKAAHDEEWYAE